MTVKSFYFRFLSVSGRMKFYHDKTPLSRLPVSPPPACLPAPLTCAQRNLILRHISSIPFAHLRFSPDICAGNPRPTPVYSIFPAHISTPQPTCAQAIPIICFERHLVSTHLGISSDMCAGNPCSTLYIQLSRRTSRLFLRHLRRQSPL